MEDYESLVQFLTDFHLLTGSNKPSILAIDNLDYFLEHRNLQPCTKKMRMHCILSLAIDSQRFLAPQRMFAQNSLIVAYRCASSQLDSQASNGGSGADPAMTASSGEAGQSTANDFTRVYTHFSIYTNQIYYLSRNAVSS